MVKPTSTAVTPAKEVQNDLDPDTLQHWLSHLAAAKKAGDETEEEQARSYASPPCYLAEFTDSDGADHTAP